MMIELLLTCVCACLVGISYRIWELNKTLKEIFVLRQKTEEFESIWKRYEHVEEPIRCKDCVNNGTSRCPCHYSGDPHIDWNPDDDWFCADGEREKGR